MIGAGLAGLSAACYLTGRGYAVTVVEREEVPGGRAGVLTRDGFTFDTGPTVLTMPDLIADALRAVGVGPRPAADAPAGPGVPGLLRRRQHDPRPLRPRGDAGRDRPDLRQRGRRRVRRLRRLAAPALRGRDAALHRRATTTPRSGCSARRGRSPSWSGWARSVGSGPRSARRFRDPRLHRLFSFQAMYAGLAPDAALALYAVITYMDSINGVYFPEGGMHAVPAAMAPGGREGRRDVPLRRRGDRDPALPDRPGGRRAHRGRASRSRPTRWSAPSTCRSRTGPSCPTSRPPRAARSGSYSPSAVVWHVGVRGVPEPPIAHHNIHFGGRVGRARSTTC